MFVEIGHFVLIIAFSLAIVQATLPLFGVKKGHLNWMLTGNILAVTQFIAILFSYFILLFAFSVNSSFWECSKFELFLLS